MSMSKSSTSKSSPFKPSTSKPVTSIVIVGGGTAGWITAGTLAAHLKANSQATVTVTLVESPTTPTIGVGEGTWPTMRNTLKKMGVRETDFIRECNATFKQGAKFCGWTTGEQNDGYYHPLVLPQGYADINLAPHWLASNKTTPFAQSVCVQAALCEAGLAPKLISTAEYAAIANYAYHLDAGAFTRFLTKHCTQNLHVQHVLADVTSVQAKENGDIESVNTLQAGNIYGDLFIDCTGFEALLIGKHFKVPFVSCKHTLFIDTTLAVHVPYTDDQATIASHTISTAQESGWIWDIGLQNRRGIGHVYSSAHTTDTQAEKALRQYIAKISPNAQDLTVRKIPIEPGHRQTFWQNNCVAIGLSAGFLEPLEASALVLIEMSATMLAEQLPTTRASMAIIAKRFNQTNTYRWQRIIDFLKLHYTLSKRTDSDFWIDNRAPNTNPDSLIELLELWKYHYPWHSDFDRAAEVFPSASYQYLLYGMQYPTQSSHLGMSDKNITLANKLFTQNKALTQKLLSSLPSNRELINKIKTYGLAQI
ncbi:tryptophan halogenase family protein [Saccharophagus degradans]|uniref:tryptophan halogenase family protein n=1 Tax=Saccharophagus degradans TaxID=86304 RepID=UPI003EBC091E